MTERAGIICAGNWIVDLIHEVTHWPTESDLVRITNQTQGIGGGPANVLAALARLDTGVQLWPMGALGDDAYADFVRVECRALGLPTDQLIRKAGAATAQTHVMSVPGQSRTFFYHGGANDQLSEADFPPGLFAQATARVFYLGYLTLLGALDRIDSAGASEAGQILGRAQRAGLITCVDLVSGDHPNYEAIITAAAPFIDYLIVNEVEATRATGGQTPPTDPAGLRAIGQTLLGRGICKAVVIHSADHVIWSGRDGTEHEVNVDPLPQEEIASHLGAGDAFCAGLLFALHEGWEPDRALGLATSVARASLRGITANSAIPPLRDLT